MKPSCLARDALPCDIITLSSYYPSPHKRVEIGGTYGRCDGCDMHHMDYCQERCYGRSWHGYLLAHTRSFLFPSSSSFLSFSIAQIRGQSSVSSRSSAPFIVTVTHHW